MRACDTCCEVAARRGLRNNPTKINISKPHLYVWLKIQSQFPLFHFLCTAEAKPHETEFTRRPKVCVYAHCDIFWNYIIVWQTLKLIFFPPPGFDETVNPHSNTLSNTLLRTQVQDSCRREGQWLMSRSGKVSDGKKLIISLILINEKIVCLKITQMPKHIIFNLRRALLICTQSLCN